MAKLEAIEYGQPFWHEGLDRNLAALNKDKAETADVIPEIGTVTLTSTKQYPFNNSETTVVLETERKTVHYSVQAEVVSSTGPVGDINVYDKATNGFKIAYTGSGSKAVVRYYVTGGQQE